MTDKKQMKKAILLVALLLGCHSATLSAQTVASASQTDPAKLEWMQHAPPPQEKHIGFADLGHYSFPKTRWSFSNFRQFVPTANIWRGHRSPSVLPSELRKEIDQLTFFPTGSDKLMSWEKSLEVNYTDAILVLHQGNIVYERYFGVTRPETPHMSFSMTKSYYGILAAMLIEEGKLDENARVSNYIPELTESGFGDATVRQVMDMTTGLAYSEDYTDPDADVFGIVYSSGIFPRPPDYQGPTSLYDFLQTIEKKGEHSQGFAYKSVNTDVLGWLIARAAGKNPTDLLSTRIWQKIGAEMDAYILVDQSGTGWASGGLNATLRDHARFGEMIRLNGNFNGQQIVPEAVVRDLRNGGNKGDFDDARYPSLAGWSYRSQWWVSHNEDAVFAARGIHGQTIYVDPKSEMVIVRLASHPQASNSNFDDTSLPAYHVVAKYLSNSSP